MSYNSFAQPDAVVYQDFTKQSFINASGSTFDSSTFTGTNQFIDQVLLDPSSEQILFGEAVTLDVDCTHVRKVRIIDTAGDTELVDTTSTQTIAGNKTWTGTNEFDDAILIDPLSLQIEFGHAVTLDVDCTHTRKVRVVDSPADANVILSASTNTQQTLTDSLQLPYVILNGPSPQLVVAGLTSYFESWDVPASLRILSRTDPGSNAAYVLDHGTYSMQGTYSFANAMTTAALTTGAINTGTSGITTNQLSAASIVCGPVNAGTFGGVFGSVTCGPFSAGTTSATVGALFSSSITSTGPFNNGTNSATMGNINCGSVAAGTNSVSCGVVNSSSITNTGAFNNGTNSATMGNISCGSVAAGTSSVSCGNITSSGVFESTGQPIFLAHKSSSANQATSTGDGTVVTVSFDVVDNHQGGTNFASNTFTAPNTGWYTFDVMVLFSGLGTVHTSANVTLLVQGSASYSIVNPIGNIGAMRDSNNKVTYGGTLTLFLTLTTTVVVQAAVFGAASGTKAAGISGDAALTCRFQGRQVA